MTDRIRTLTVILDRDYRDDDAEQIINAIRMTKGVTAVESTVVTGSDMTARLVVAGEFRLKLLKAIQETLVVGAP